MKLSKKIPARTKIVEFTWCTRNWVIMNPQFRFIRKRFRNKFDKCGWCGHAITDGEMMAIAGKKVGGNVVLCKKCTDELMTTKESGE